MRKLYILFISLFVVLPFMLNAQHDLTLYQMERVPQRLSVNPSFIPETSYMGIPFLSDFNISFTEPWRYNQVFKRNGQDTLELQAESVLNTLGKNGRFHTETEYSIFAFGLKAGHGKYFLNFGLKQKMTQDMFVPENFLSMLWYGNGSPEFLGERMTIHPLMGGSVYDEWSAGVAGTFLNNKLNVGITAKYLSGRFNVTTEKADFTFYTEKNFYDIYISSDMKVKTSGIDDIDTYFDQPAGSIVFPGNNGFAIDLGATYRINDKLTASASIIDLGFINWKTRNLTLVSKEPGKEFLYNGMTVSDFMDMFTDFSSFGQTVLDSISDLIKVDSVRGEKYTSGIPQKYNLAGSYRINDVSSVNLLLHGMYCNQHFYPALSADYTFNCTKAIALNISYSIYNHQYTNVGGGFTLNAGAFQFYMVSDNLPGLLWYRGTNNSSFRFGFNILLHRNPHQTNQTEETTPETGS